MTCLSRRFLATLSITCFISAMHSWTDCCWTLLVPAAMTVTSLSAGMCLIWALIWRTVCPGYTYPVAWKPRPWTIGATPLTMELPIIVTVVPEGGITGLVVRWGDEVTRCWDAVFCSSLTTLDLPPCTPPLWRRRGDGARVWLGVPVPVVSETLDKTVNLFCVGTVTHGVSRSCCWDFLICRALKYPVGSTLCLLIFEVRYSAVLH